MLNDKFAMIKANFTQQFDARVMSESGEDTYLANLNIEEVDNTLLIKMSRNGNQHVLTIPMPYMVNGISLVSANGIERAECKYYWKAQDMLMTYADVIYEILLGFPAHMLPPELLKGQSAAVQQLKYGYENDKLTLSVYTLQKRLNYIYNQLPLHETDFNSLVLNSRITIMDPEFDIMSDPEEKHAYQVQKNKDYYAKGWTSLGLSDGSLADKNYMLDFDLRRLSPFGPKFHNPQRNLYSTLGMRGDETPLLHSRTTSELSKLGLTRKGWNLFTLFVDIPDVFEDQLMVDISHSDKFIAHTKRILCHGQLLVGVGQEVKFGDPLYVNLSEEVKRVDIQCDGGIVTKIENTESNVGGVSYIVQAVTIMYKRYLTDGTKLTNLAANKGVIRMRDLGYAINPKTGEKQKIDVIVSSKAVLKRKNYTQVLEAILNTVNDNNSVVVPDDIDTSEEAISNALVAAGYNADGTWECHTYAGKLRGVAGKVFWGVTHDANDTVWRPNAVTATNGRGLRTAGLKFSNIEFRALSTRFGANNALEKEILSFAQGHEDVRELLDVLKFKLGKTVLNHSVINYKDIKPIEQSSGTMHSEEDLEGTIVDPALCEEGFVIELPVSYQVSLDDAGNVLAEGFPNSDIMEIDEKAVAKRVVFNTVYVPYDNLRKCWVHDIGRYGFSDIGVALNTLLIMCHSYVEDDQSGTTIARLYRAIASYFGVVSNKLSTKRGELSVHGTSVRYPNSAKGVATLSNVLPPNTVEIHRDMAKSIGVSTNDIVLVERFPCLGFMSLRPQRVQVTSDPLAKFSIRASGNSLGSLSLDFDGDVLYIASFHTEEAKAALEKEFYSPNEHCYEQIMKFNDKMGLPRTKEMSLYDYHIESFAPLNSATHAEIVSKLTGVKSNTGPVVALAYNILRIMENSKYAGNQRIECLTEVFVDTVANSVFKQKHGVKSLHKVVMDGVCSADEASLIKEGFDPEISRIVCNEIRAKAKQIGIDDVAKFHQRVQEKGGSTVINRIVKAQNILYFTSRSNLEGCRLVQNVMSHEIVDIPSTIFNKIMSAPTRLQVADKKMLDSITNVEDRSYCAKIFHQINADLLNTRSVSILNKE